MANPWENDPIVTPAPDANAPWKSDPIVQAPKAPDMSGVQDMARKNLADNDNQDTENAKPQTPEDRLNTAVGMPVTGMLSGGDRNTPVPAPVRAQYTKALRDGSADNFGDFMQSALHAVAPIAASVMQKGTSIDVGKAVLSTAAKGAEYLATSTPGSIASDVLQNTINLPVQGATRLLGAAYEGVGGELPLGVARALTQGIPEFGQDKTRLAIRGALNTATQYQPITPLGETTTAALNIAPYLAGGEESLASKAIGSALSGAGSVAGTEAAKQMGFGEKGQQIGNVLGGAPGLIGGAKGIWDDRPGAETLRKPIAQALEKDPAAVTSHDIDQHIAKTVEGKVPPGKDFQTVNTIMGGDKLQTLHNVYDSTGVAPDQVWDDARHDPGIAADISVGKVPEAYEHLAEPAKNEFSELKVAPSETAKAFDVVDAEGDHVQGGFTSAEEAREYIEDKKSGTIPDEPPEWKKQLSLDKSKDEAEDTRGAIGQTLEKEKENGAGNQINRNSIENETVGPRDVQGSDGGVGSRSEQIGRTSRLAQRIGRTEAVSFQSADEVQSAKQAGQLGPKAEKVGACYKTAGDIALKYKQNMVIGTVDNGFGKRIYHAVNYVEDGGKNYIYDGTYDAFFTPEAYDHLANGWTPVDELSPAEVRDHMNNRSVYPDPSSRGLPPAEKAGMFSSYMGKFLSSEEGKVATDAYRKAVGETIKLAEKIIGNLTGDLFPKLGEAYIKTFQPELVGDKALRADAYLAKYKTAIQEAENAFYRQSAENKAAFDKMPSEDRMQWLYDHETGNWTEHSDPDHARYQALLDATFKAEKEAIGADADKGYKENYLPHAWEKPDAVKAFFNSDIMLKKYGKDGFTKASTFQLIQDGVRAGFRLKSDNPEVMLRDRLAAGHNMIATMDLLKDMESSGIAKPARAFSADKRIAKIQSAIDEAQSKYDAASLKINDPKQMRWDFADPAVNKYMKDVQARIDVLKERLEKATAERNANTLTPDQMNDLNKNGFKIIGPDSKVWNIQNQVAPLWKNVMEMKGLYEREGVTGDAYRGYTAAKALWTQVKLGLSLFHPVHVAMINLASGIAASADHLIQGGKLSDLALRDTGITMGLTKDTFKGQDHPALKAWNTSDAERTPEQKQIVQTMIEGGFKPTMSARDTVHFRENFDKAINGVGLNNLRLIGTAIQLPGLLMKPFFEHWIPAMKSEIYLRRTSDAVTRDPSLATDAGKRGEVFRQIAKDTDRTYGEMNNEVQFWNKTVRDSFNAAFISGGWKLAQIYNARGLLQPAKIAYNFAKTGEFSKADITYNMLHAYTYTGLTLALGAAINAMLGNPIGQGKDDVWDIVKDCVFPKTGEKNPDGTPIRLNQPAFAKDAYMLARDINTKGLIGGSGSFLYHQTLIPGIVDTLNNRDFTGKQVISDPTDLHQWMNAGWQTISPISVSTYQKAEAKHSTVGKIAGVLGFPTAGAYVNETPFEQKVLELYDEQNPPKTDVYSSKLKTDLKSAIRSNDPKEIESVKQEMKREGMTDSQINAAGKTFEKPFIESAWKRLSIEDQKRLIESASEEEKKKFRVKSR